MKAVAKKQKYTTTFVERGSFWMYGVGMLFYYQIVGSFLNTLLILKGIDLTKVAIILLGVKVWDAVNDPLFAYVFDRVKFKKEKCLPWLRIAALAMPLASIAIFNMPGNMSEATKLVWFAVTYIIWDATYTICDVPFFSMTTTMTVNMDERNTLFSFARVFHGAGSILCTTIMTLLIGENIGMSIGMAAIIVCGIGAIFTIPLLFLGKERYAVKEDSQEESNFTLKEMFTYLKQNKYLTIMYGCQIIMQSFYTGNAAGMVGTYYLYGQTTFGVIVEMLKILPGPILGMLLPLILKKIDRFKLYISCIIFCLVWGVVDFSAYYFGFLSVEWAIINSIVIAIPSTLSGLVAYMFTLDAIEYGKYKTGIDATGINFAVQTFSAKIPPAIASAFGTFLLGLTTFVLVEAESIADLVNSGVTQTDEAISQMYLVIKLPTLISQLVSVILLLCFYKLRSKDVAIMAKCNAGEITRVEAEAQLSRKY